MAFTTEIKETVLTQSARHCCVCHRKTGLNIEVHHIIPKEQGGEDTLENAIPLCFDCHADAGHYHAKHPKGIKLSPKELKKHKKYWFELVKNNKIENVSLDNIFFEAVNDEIFKPEFIKRKFTFRNKTKYIESLKFLGITLKKLKKGNPIKDEYFKHKLSKIRTLEEYVDFLNEGLTEKPNYFDQKDIDIQPKQLDLKIDLNGKMKIYNNKSSCIVNFRLKNNSIRLIENFKIYLSFKNVVKAERLRKGETILDSVKYDYNINSLSKSEIEFQPDISILVQKDFINLDPICFVPTYETNEVIVNWQLLAKDFDLSGIIVFKIDPQIEVWDIEKYIDDVNETMDKQDIQMKII